MAKTTWKNGQTSVVLRVFIPDSASASGNGKTGLTYTSSGLIVSVIADNEAATTTYTAAGSTIETITTLGTFAAPTSGKCRFREVDSTYQPGVYELQIADARWAVSGARSVQGMVLGASGAAPVPFEVQLTAVDPQDAAAGGMSSLASAAASSSSAASSAATAATQATSAATSAATAATQATTAATNTTTLLARLGGWTGTGLNTVLGAMRALAAKASSLTPTDLSSGTTFDNTTDSQEGIRDAVSSATDPLTNPVPGSYPSGSAGHALGRIGSGQITTVSTVAQNGDIEEIIGGADYDADDGLAFDWTDASDTWPVLTDATIAWKAEAAGGVSASYAGSVVTGTGSGKKVRLELTAAQSAALEAAHVGVWDFVVWATLAPSGRKIALVWGAAPVKAAPGP